MQSTLCSCPCTLHHVLMHVHVLMSMHDAPCAPPMHSLHSCTVPASCPWASTACMIMHACRLMAWVVSWSGGAEAQVASCVCVCVCVCVNTGVFSPSLNDLDYVNNYHNAMTNVMRTELRILNNTAAFPAASFPGLARNVSGLASNITAMNNFKTYGKIDQYDMMAVLKNVTWLYVNATLPVVPAAAPLQG